MAEKSACKVEHVMDPAIIERLICLTQWMQELPENIKSGFTQRIQAHIEAQKFVMKPCTLDKIEPGARAVITKITIRGEIGQRLLDMGVTKGTDIQVIKVAPLGDPIEIKIKGYHLSLRKTEAQQIQVAR